MVRKVISLIIALAVLLAVPISASAATPYSTVPSNVVSVFKDLAGKVVGFNDDYLLYCASQNVYVLVVGKNVRYDSSTSTFSFPSNSDGYRVYRYSVNSTTNSTTLSESWVSSGPVVTISNSFVYSNLGHYPDLIERSSYYEIATLLLLLACLFCYLLRSIFRFCFRSRSQ